MIQDFRLQGNVKATVSGVFEDHKKKFQKARTKIEVVFESSLLTVSAAETANRAKSGQLQSWSKPSEILNLRSSNTPETVDFNIP